MKKIIALSAVLSMILFSGCGNSSESNSESKSTEPTTTEVTTVAEETETTTEAETTVTTIVTTTAEAETTEEVTEPTTEAPTEVPEEARLFSTSTSQMTKGFDDILFSVAESKGLEITYDEETLSFSAPQSVLSEIASEFCANLNNLYLTADTTDSSLKKIVINNDYSVLDVYVTSDFTSSYEALSLLILVQPMGNLQMLAGKPKEEVRYTQRVIDIDTGEIISEGIFPDDIDF